MGHIWVDDRGIAWVDDTNVKVIEVALDKIACDLSPEQMVSEHYGHLSLAQIHAALAWYYDHQPEFDAEIERQYQDSERMRSGAMNSPLRQKLRAIGKVP